MKLTMPRNIDALWHTLTVSLHHQVRALLFLLLLPLTASADSDDYLVPTGGKFDDPYLVEYYGPLRQKLHEDLPFRSPYPRFEQADRKDER